MNNLRKILILSSLISILGIISLSSPTWASKKHPRHRHRAAEIDAAGGSSDGGVDRGDSETCSGRLGTHEVAQSEGSRLETYESSGATGPEYNGL